MAQNPFDASSDPPRYDEVLEQASSISAVAFSSCDPLPPGISSAAAHWGGQTTLANLKQMQPEQVRQMILSWFNNTSPDAHEHLAGLFTSLVSQVSEVSRKLEDLASERTLSMLLDRYCKYETAVTASSDGHWQWGTQFESGRYIAFVDWSKPHSGYTKNRPGGLKARSQALFTRFDALWLLLHDLELEREADGGVICDDGEYDFDRGAIDVGVIDALVRGCEVLAAETLDKKDVYLWRTS